jgi:hypothetical protein
MDLRILVLNMVIKVLKWGCISRLGLESALWVTSPKWYDWGDIEDYNKTRRIVGTIVEIRCCGLQRF